MVREHGFVTGELSPCHVFRQGWQQYGLVHGGDFVFGGKGELPQVVASRLADGFAVKVAAIGPGTPGVFARAEQKHSVGV